MNPPASHDEPPAPPQDDHPAEGRLRRRIGAARVRYQGSWVGAIVAHLKALQFFEWTTIFGAELLWSALPFIILLSSLANERIDDDLSRHIGVNGQGAQIVRSLFRNSPTHAVVPIATGLLFTLAGVIAVVSSLQALYERAFDQEHRGWRDLPRYFAYVGILLAVLIADGSIDGAERRAAGVVVQAVLTFVVVAIFFAWTMHFLLAGRVSWRRVVRPALVTAVLWLGLAFFSSAYLSSAVIDDTRTYGTIGVVFTLLTWFILIGSVVVLGAGCGAVWQQRRESDDRSLA
ncbi:MAG: YihY/virulence factor BrkB family protein [Solirubrobacteraceae bacterium]